jgi:hypothetical protein
MGVCFTCATAESIIEDGTDMYDSPVERVEGHSLSAAKLKAILKLYNAYGINNPIKEEER